MPQLVNRELLNGSTYHPNFVHGNVFEVVNKNFFTLMTNTEVIDAKTITKSNMSATTDGYLFFNNQGWSLEIKLPVSYVPKFLPVNYYMEIVWGFEVHPDVIAGSFFLSQVWIPARLLTPKDNPPLAWVTITLLDQDIPGPTHKDMYECISNGVRWMIENFYLTPTGVRYMQQQQQVIFNTFPGKELLMKVGYVCDNPPRIKNPKRSLNFMLLDGYFTIVGRCDLNKSLTGLAQRYNNMLREMAREMPTKNRASEIFMGGNFFI